MPKEIREYQHGSGSSVPDISQLATTYLRPPQPKAESPAQQITWHEGEIQHLLELAYDVEQAITALVFRLHRTTDPRLYEALRDNRADLRRFKDELESLQTEHQHAIERIQKQIE